MRKINIIGSGTAGLAAAIYAAVRYDAEVDVYTDSRLGRSNSCMAQSGYRWKSHLYKYESLKKEAKTILSRRLIEEIENGDDIMDLLGMKDTETIESVATIDQLSSLRMIKDEESKVGVKLIRKMVDKVRNREKIKVYENHIVRFKENCHVEFEADDIKTKIKRYMPRERTILAIGGGLGAEGKITTNMKYSDYSIIEQIVNKDHVKVQYHPFGMAGNDNMPLKCVPECIAVKGVILNENTGQMKRVRDFKGREECVQWLDNYQGDNYLLLKGEYTREGGPVKRGVKFGNKVRIVKAEHYLLRGIEDTDLLCCGECRNGDFMGYRPAGMGITQSILSAKTAVDQILG